jgi:hypothetical protein
MINFRGTAKSGKHRRHILHPYPCFRMCILRYEWFRQTRLRHTRCTPLIRTFPGNPQGGLPSHPVTSMRFNPGYGRTRDLLNRHGILYAVSGTRPDHSCQSLVHRLVTRCPPIPSLQFNGRLAGERSKHRACSTPPSSLIDEPNRVAVMHDRKNASVRYRKLAGACRIPHNSRRGILHITRNTHNVLIEWWLRVDFNHRPRHCEAPAWAVSFVIYTNNWGVRCLNCMTMHNRAGPCPVNIPTRFGPEFRSAA